VGVVHDQYQVSNTVHADNKAVAAKRAGSKCERVSYSGSDDSYDDSQHVRGATVQNAE